MKERLLHIARKRFHLPKAEDWKRAYEHFSLAEKIAFFGLFALCIGALLSMLSAINSYISTDVPVRGGALVEGVIGSPRFINPLLAVSDADRDLSALVYSGLLRATPQGGLQPDLAESYEISEDGLTYTFKLREDIHFHDGYPVTAEDVEFTVLRTQDPALKSPKRANWDSVRVERVNEREIRFTLKQAYAPFLENATLGILPKHLWKNASPEEFALSFLNIEPVGSGPYQVDTITRNASGLPERYDLASFSGYALGEPYVASISFQFYPNEAAVIEALKKGDITSANSLPPEDALALKLRDAAIVRTPLPRIFAVFFNQNQNPVLLNREVRVALDAAVDKQAIVDTVLHGFGVVAEGPLPAGVLKEATPFASSTERIAEARAGLEAAGWSWNEAEQVLEKKSKKDVQRLALSLSTSNAPELKQSAEMIKAAWEKLGAKVTLQIFETGDLNQNVIRPRRYDALLFGQIIGRDLDLFAFWHSSQRNDPGLNIALYTNIKADRLLSSARATADTRERLSLYRSVASEVEKDVPAVFLYSPDFIYLVPESLKGVKTERLTTPSERFLGVEQWYIETESVWQFLTRN
ncbi:MAG TPA: ABC transporter substrate-binding protein [Candidatus Paceibacterota bacterium]|nr:ABC transporter substrate-binding protein [Candidatus Paceibacterota bacterium]